MPRRKCQDCKQKIQSFGLPAEGKARWCGGCALGHTGAINVRTSYGDRKHGHRTSDGKLQQVMTQMGPVRVGEKVQVKFEDDGLFYGATVTRISTRAVTVTYPETSEWDVWDERIKLEDVLPARVRLDTTVDTAGRAARKRAAAADATAEAHPGALDKRRRLAPQEPAGCEISAAGCWERGDERAEALEWQI